MEKYTTTKVESVLVWLGRAIRRQFLSPGAKKLWFFRPQNCVLQSLAVFYPKIPGNTPKTNTFREIFKKRLTTYGG
ncbi:MAG: hypothetical protein IJA69_05545, partial [Clostridia bacterium]|nr:hypothetical protein [Clostridia bacterium]